MHRIEFTTAEPLERDARLIFPRPFGTCAQQLPDLPDLPDLPRACAFTGGKVCWLRRPVPGRVPP